MPAITTDNFASLLSLGGAALAAGLLLVVPRGAIVAVEGMIRSIANRRVVLLVLIPALSFVVNAAITLKNGIPRPRVQDEFSYLLAADTFAHGRLTNPTPAFWEHFETPHELMRPTYMSKYPPGQGIALAVGQVLENMPIVGVWLTTATACAAIYWMLLGFVSPPWAMLGGFVAAIHPELIAWSQNYWGGGVAVLGGAMVLGGWARLLSRSSIGPVVILGIGLIILANSRPYEGLVLATPLMLVLLYRRSKIVFPLLLILIPALVAMGYYNFRITGHALQMPFAQYSSQYDVYPKFWFLSTRTEPAYSNDALRAIHTVYERGEYDTLRTPRGLLVISLQRLWTLIAIHAHPWVLLIPLSAGIILRRSIDEKIRWIWITAGIFLVGLWAENFFLPHYAAPITAAILLLIVISWRQLWQWSRVAAWAVAVGFVIGAAVSAAAPVDPDSQRTGQTELIRDSALLQSGKHLIFVRYTPDHLLHDEWVYNQANIEDSRIIWARSFDKASDALVAQHYAGRSVWILTVGKDDLQLVPYELP